MTSDKDKGRFTVILDNVDPNSREFKGALFRIGTLIRNQAVAEITQSGAVDQGYLRARIGFRIESSQDISRVIVGAFGVKYAGIFLLPFITIPVFLRLRVHSKTGDLFWIVRWFALACGSVGSFLAAWLLTNPYAAIHIQGVGEAFFEEEAHLMRGHGLAEPRNPFLWIHVLVDQFTIVDHRVTA